MAIICPRCLADMHELDVEGVTIDVCEGCRGIWLDPGELSLVRGADTDLPSAPEQLASGPRFTETTTYICPRCEGGFESFEFAPGTELILDRCKECKGLYLDAGELKKVRAATDQRRRLGLTSPDESGARLRDAVMAEQRRSHLAGGGSSAGVYFFQLLTGLPVEVDAPRQRFPWVVLGLIGACALGFAIELTHLGAQLTEQLAFLRRWAFVPDQFAQGQGWQGLLTGMFLHGSWWHLLANMYFLWLFGDNVEDRMNRALFATFFLTCGVAAFGLHAAVSGHSQVPVLGASGAISGLMGAYLVLYPRRQLYQVFWFIQFRISVVFYLVVWLGLQILFSALGSAGVAWFAHIGGFVFGALGLWLLQNAGWVRPDPFAPPKPAPA